MLLIYQIILNKYNNKKIYIKYFIINIINKFENVNLISKLLNYNIINNYII